MSEEKNKDEEVREDKEELEEDKEELKEDKDEKDAKQVTDKLESLLAEISSNTKVLINLLSNPKEDEEKEDKEDSDLLDDVDKNIVF